MPEFRYRDNPVRKDSRGKRVFTSTIPPKIDKTPEDIYIVSREGDRLDLLANEYYGDVSKWVIIATANQLGKGTFEIPPGTQVRIPADDDLIVTNWSANNLNR